MAHGQQQSFLADRNRQNPEVSKLQRARAKEGGLSVGEYRVLLCLRSAGRALNYREIEAETGYYANLARMLRADTNPESLGGKGMVMEGTDGIRKLTFEITPRGESLLRRLDKFTLPEKPKKMPKDEEAVEVIEIPSEI